MRLFKFDLERALKGAKVITRDGTEVTICGANNDASEHHKVIGWVRSISLGWSFEGIFERDKESHLDLFMAEPHRSKKYVNVHTDDMGDWVDECIYTDLKEAEEVGKGDDTYLQTIEIKYEFNRVF